jgi:iron complex outermembrane recepter protein
MKKVNLTTLCLIYILNNTPLKAQTPHSHHDKGEKHRAQEHHDSLTHIEVLTVHGQHSGNVWNEAVESVTVLEGDQLAKKSQTTLGETLAKEIGISSTQFGPNASRPVIRGLDGNRIRLLQDGMGINDLSGASQDHAIPINPLVSERVEVVRGPLNLLYGSSAIGGVVNVVTSRIHKNYHEHATGGIDVKSDSSNNGQNMAMNMDYGAQNFMLHLDADMGQADSLKSPKSKINNSEFQQKSYSVGTSYFVDDDTYVGVGYSLYDNLYGVVAEEDVDIDMKQQRVDLLAHHDLKGFFTSVQLKSTQTFYEHAELEGTEVGTEFDNEANESRLELYHRFSDRMTGILGLQTQINDFKAVGEEAFLPFNKTEQYALFLFEQLKRKWGKINLGLRFENTKVKADAGNILTTSKDKEYNSFSAATGFLYNINPSFTTGLNLSYNERAATFQELYSQGAHIAIGKYVQGQENLNKEKSFAVEWSLRHKTKEMEGVFNLFGHKFDNYIALNPTGSKHDTDESGIAGDSTEDFDIYHYEQNKAMIYGAEMSFSHFLNSQIQWTVKGDYLRGRNSTFNQNLARITPIRLIGEVRYLGDYFNTGLEVQRVFQQDHTANNETATPAYTLINFDYSHDLKVEDQTIMLYGQINNITDEVAVNHVSIIKDNMRMAKRHIVVGVRASF